MRMIASDTTLPRGLGSSTIPTQTTIR